MTYRRALPASAALGLILGCSACASQLEADAAFSRATSNVTFETSRTEIPVVLASDQGVIDKWRLNVSAPGLKGVAFANLEIRSGYFETVAGDYVSLLTNSDDKRNPVGIRRLQRGPSPEALGTMSVDPAFRREPSSRPDLLGYDYIDSSIAVFHRGARRFVGLWRSREGEETLVVNYDDPVSANPGVEIIARIDLPASVVSTNGDHHGGPSEIVIATDPDDEGVFQVVGFTWPVRCPGTDHFDYSPGPDCP